MTLLEGAQRLGRALKRATDEHGRPNRFGCEELAVLHGGPPAPMQGRIGRRPDLHGALYEAAGGRGGIGSCPVYDPEARQWVV